jgi:hypothetical protein
MNTLSFNGAVIRDRNEFLSLTDMWKAAGSKPDKAPANWVRQKATSDFIEHIAAAYDKHVNSHVIDISRGRGGGTWAHWQIGLAYAKFLNNDFHVWANEVVRARMEGRAAEHGDLRIAPLEAALLALAERVSELSKMADHRLAVAEYMSVRQAMDRAKADPKGRRKLQGALFRRLMDRAATTGVALRRDPHSPTQIWLFPIGFMNACMAEFGNALVAEHNDAIGRQGVLPFKKPVAVQTQEEARV